MHIIGDLVNTIDDSWKKLDVPRSALMNESASLERSKIMRFVKSKNTKPELIVRQLLTKLGCRYRLHRAELPGKPDIAFIGRKKVIFVHGCFWHGHDCKRGARVPKANRGYWVAKITRNRQRDKDNLHRLSEQGWRYICVFECEMKDAEALSVRLTDFLIDNEA